MQDDAAAIVEGEDQIEGRHTSHLQEGRPPSM